MTATAMADGDSDGDVAALDKITVDCIKNNLLVFSPDGTHIRYGASLGGALCFINNPTLRLFSRTCYISLVFVYI
jgi:hypothetical protein